MASIYFCAYDGTMFRGKMQSHVKFPTCSYPEKPQDHVTGFLPCLSCRYYAEGYRDHHYEAYRYIDKQTGKRTHIIVAGAGYEKTQLRKNRSRVIHV